MKKVLLGAAAAALLSTPALAADTQTSTVTISGSVANTCTLGSPAASGLVNASVTGTAITITALADTNDATLEDATAVLTYAGMCNYAHTLSLQSANGGLIQASPATVVGGTFIQRIGYDATLDWAGAQSALALAHSTSSSASGGTTTDSDAIAGANAGNLVLTVDLDASSDPVVAGNYSDTLTVQIGAAL